MRKPETTSLHAYRNLPDTDIVRLCRQGRTEAFSVLVERYEGRVLRLVRRRLRNHDRAVEETQEIFIKIFCKLDLFRGEASFKTWLYRVAVNHCLNAGKRRRVLAGAWMELPALEQAQAGKRQIYLAADHILIPEEAYARQELGRLVRSLIDRLPGNQRRALMLWHYENLSYAEIADVMRMPLGRLRSCLYRARRQLKRLLEDAGGPQLLSSA